MTALVTVEAYSGTLRRYEVAPGIARLSHQCTIGKPVTFTKAVVEDFRAHPPEQFAIDSDPQPTGPAANAMPIPRAA